MKNNLVKFYITAFFLCCSLATFAQPGSGSDNGGVDDNGSGDSTPAAPIDDSLWILLAIGLVFAFLRFRAIYKQVSNS
jgi:hypothetical protein